jgi:hypothetical protein
MTAVLDVEPREAAVPPGGDPEPPPPIHRVARVHAEVHQDLLHTAAVGEDGGQIRIDRHFDLDLASEIARKHPQRLRDDFVDLDPVALGRSSPRERQELSRQVPGAGDGGINLIEIREPSGVISGRVRSRSAWPPMENSMLLNH